VFSEPPGRRVAGKFEENRITNLATHSRPTILIVEDEARIRKLVRTALSKAGYAVLEAAGGPEALAIIRSFDADIPLAILDIMMPGINGLDLANQLGVERPATQILYISGLEDSVAVETITRAAPQAMLAKPFTPRQLIDRVESLLSRD
jgi:DNA-binding response OmpR family regulator